MEIAACVFSIIFWILLIITFIRDRSRYRNCYFLFFAVLFTIAALSFAGEEFESNIILFEFLILFLALLITPFFLICNGVLMFRREGHSLSNLLSFVLGLVVLIGELATFVAVLMPEMIGAYWTGRGPLYDLSIGSMFLSVSVIYLSISFVIFMLYCVFLQIIPRKRDFDYVIIHGAGLLEGGRMSKLLSQRLDKAIEVYRKDPTPPILIPSGGKGSDEIISEAEAMERYLLEKGIPAEMIIKEDQSETTFENLANSKAIIDAREGSKYTVLVTSNYHVYRALRYCRKIGLKATGVGSHVAFYYWPSALIREYIAVHAEKKHLIILIAGWVLLMAFLASLYFL
ncbi:MAG: YdcF family protein [Firmicutes bacterium]|nr:YdcF family protein [Bacillota bacterium]